MTDMTDMTDLCDVCMSSGVEIDHTHADGKTVCVECAEACDHQPEDEDADDNQ